MAYPRSAAYRTGIAKTFDRTRALVGAHLDLLPGRFMACSAPTAPASRRCPRSLPGTSSPTRARLLYRGQPLRLRSTRDALDTGIAIVMQETSLVPDLSVAENIFLPELAARAGCLLRPTCTGAGREMLAALGQEDGLPLDIKVRHLSAAQRQLVEIAKALGVEAELIIFDEPTASLSPSEVDRLFDIMARLRGAADGLIFVSHRLEEVFEITDRVTIMREGRTVAGLPPTASLTQAELIRHMVGRDLGGIYAPGAAPVRQSGGAGCSCMSRPRRAAAGARRLLRGASRARSSASAGWSAPGDRRRSRRSSACARAVAAACARREAES